MTGPLFEDQGPELAWQQRTKVTVQVEATATLADAIDAAAAKFGIRLQRGEPRPVSSAITGVALYKPADDVPEVYPGPFKRDFRVVDEDGRLGWKPYDEASMGDLLRAFEAGLEGDPQRPYLWPMVPQGDFGGLLGSWDVLLQGLELARHAAEAMAAVYGASEFLAAVRRRLGQSSEVPAEKLTALEASPGRISELLGLRPFGAAELGKLLGLTEEEALALAMTLGLAEGDDGRWSLGVGEDVSFVRRLIEFLLQHEDTWPKDSDALPEFIRDRLTARIEERPEGVVAWQNDWFTRTYDSSQDAAPYTEAGVESRYEIVVVPIDDGVDVADLERVLNEGTASYQESHLAAVLPDQRLRDGTLAHVFIVLRLGD